MKAYSCIMVHQFRLCLPGCSLLRFLLIAQICCSQSDLPFLCGSKLKVCHRIQQMVGRGTERIPVTGTEAGAGSGSNAAAAGGSGKRLSNGAIAGATIGTLAGVAAIAAAAVLAARKLKSSKPAPEGMSTFNQAFNQAA